MDAGHFLRNCDEEILQIKDMQYGTLFILLDNCIPLVLSINSLTFKLNNNLQSTSDPGSEYMSEQTSLQQSTTGVDKQAAGLICRSQVAGCTSLFHQYRNYPKHS